MKLRTIHVEGFGLLRNKTLQLEGPLTVLYGRNEAGKSTLMGFIRAVLFGFPARSVGAGGPEPLMGTAHGGFLTLETAEGERIRVERRETAPASAGRARAPGGGHVRVTLASGVQGGAELLEPLLGGITGELFRSLFAFSLSELQEVRTLQSDALSGYLYSAGLGARGATIMAAERKLALEMDQLYRPRGRNQAINLTLQKLEELELESRRSKEQAGRYNDYMLELARLDTDIQAQDNLIREHRNQIAWLEVAEQARSQWDRGNEITILLTGLPEFDNFPEDALNRFNQMTKDKELLLSEQDKHQLQVNQMLQEIEAIQIDPTILRNHDELVELVDQLTAFQVNQDAEKALKPEIEHQQIQLLRLLKQIAVHWDEAVLEHYAVTVVQKEQVRHWDTELIQRLHNSDQDTLELQRAANQLKEAKVRANSLESKLLLKHRQVFADLTLEAQQEMDALNMSVSQLRKLLQQKQQLKQELRHINQRESDQDRLGVRARAEASQTNPGFNIFRALRWFSLAAAVLFPIYLIQQELIVGALISFILLVIIALGIWFNTPRVANPVRTQRVTNIEKIQLEQDLTLLEESLNQRLGQLAGLAQTASASSDSNGHLTELQLEEGIDRLQQAAEQWREGKRELALEELRWQEAADLVEKLHNSTKTAEAKLNESAENVALAVSDWQNWLIKHQLSTDLSPSGAIEVLQLIEAGQHQQQQKQRNEKKLKAIQNQLLEFEQRVHEGLGINTTIEDIPTALKKWKQTADYTAQALINRNLLEQQVKSARTQLQLILDSLERTHQHMVELWQEAAASDEQQFRLHVRQHNERISYKTEWLQIQSTLNVFLDSARREQLTELLSELSTEELEDKKTAQKMELIEVEMKADKLKDRRGKLRSELEHLEQGEEHSERLQQVQEQKSILAEQAAQWAKAAFCARLFKQARELYERERQPGVMRMASSYFQTITAEEYKRVLVPIGEKKIRVEHASGRMMDSALLSRGTAEQLYLAIRFALAEEYARKASLPLILDDIMVNFDKERMQQTITLLKQISANHQIIFFTCHRHVADAFAEQMPAHQQIKL